jgi:hypothetical protein
MLDKIALARWPILRRCPPGYIGRRDQTDNIALLEAGYGCPNGFDDTRSLVPEPTRKLSPLHKAPADYPSGKAGDVITVEFTVLGIPCLGLNGGPAFRHSEAFSFQIATDNQRWIAVSGRSPSRKMKGSC